MRTPLGFDKIISIRVEPELCEALADVARKERITPSEAARRGLRAVVRSYRSGRADDEASWRPGSEPRAA